MLLFFRFAILEFVYLLKMAQQSEKGTGCVIPKENINRISTIVDEEYFLVLCTLSLFGTKIKKRYLVIV